MLDDTVKMVCLETEDREGVRPKLATTQVLLTFATRTNQQDEVVMRLQRYLPELWESLPLILEASQEGHRIGGHEVKYSLIV